MDVILALQHTKDTVNKLNVKWLSREMACVVHKPNKQLSLFDIVPCRFDIVVIIHT